MRREVLLVVPALLLAGCAGFGGDSGRSEGCAGRAPLQVKAFPDFVVPGNTRFEVSLWNCADARALRVENPCGQHATLAPRLDVDGVRYAIEWNGSAVPEADLACHRGDEPETFVVEPRHYLQDSAYSWNGTVRGPDGAVVRVPGNHTVFAELGGYRARVFVEVQP